MSLDATLDTPAEAKKKPGRPKKKPVSLPVEMHGVVNTPANPEDLLELVYCNPGMFKKLLQLYKQFSVSEVEMNFNNTSLKIITKDHLGKSTIYAIIDGNCMNLYYCKAPMRVCVKRDSLEKVLGALVKSHYKITFVLKENYRSVMYMIIKDLEYNNDNSYEIDVVYKPETTETEHVDDDITYPISFKLSFKHFKQLINHIKKLSSILSIQKDGAGPLQITYGRSRGVNWTNVYNESDKICLKSTIAPDDVFSVSVPVDHIRPLAASGIGEEVIISADKKQRMSFSTRLDEKVGVGWGCAVKIYTEIKDYRA